MSEVISKLKRMLAQSQRFLGDAPQEAVARAQLAVREADKAIAGTADAQEREQLVGLRAIAASRVEKYQAANQAWSAENQARANLFAENEQTRLEQPIAGKLF